MANIKCFRKLIDFRYALAFVQQTYGKRRTYFVFFFALLHGVFTKSKRYKFVFAYEDFLMASFLRLFGCHQHANFSAGAAISHRTISHP